MEWHEEKRGETLSAWRAAWDYQRKLDNARKRIAQQRAAQQGGR